MLNISLLEAQGIIARSEPDLRSKRGPKPKPVSFQEHFAAAEARKQKSLVEISREFGVPYHRLSRLLCESSKIRWRRKNTGGRYPKPLRFEEHAAVVLARKQLTVPEIAEKYSVSFQRLRKILYN